MPATRSAIRPAIGPRRRLVLLAALLLASPAIGRGAEGGGTSPQPGNAGAGAGPAPRSMRVYVGTYTGAKSKGIYVMNLDLAAGTLSDPELAAETPNPTFLALRPGDKFLYAANEVGSFGGKKNTASVTAFAIAADTGKLTPLNAEPSGGGGNCFVTTDAAGKNVLAANYGTGSVCVLPIRDDGSLAEPSCVVQHEGNGSDPKRQEGPHAHSIYVGPGDRFAYSCDLGLDKIFISRLDQAKGVLTPNDPPFATVAPGAGPRHLAFSPDGRFAYVINEMGNTITAFTHDAAAGTMSEIQTISTLPADFHGENTTAEIFVHPSGKFVYGSNRGHNSIAAFTVDAQTGKLTAAGHTSTQGKGPRNFNIDPTGKYLLAANQGTDNVVVFRIDAGSGALTPTGATAHIGAPVCVVFVPVTR